MIIRPIGGASQRAGETLSRRRKMAQPRQNLIFFVTLTFDTGFQLPSWDIRTSKRRRASSQRARIVWAQSTLDCQANVPFNLANICRCLISSSRRFGGQGIGIHLSSDARELISIARELPHGGYVLQKYIRNPLLVNGFKFTMYDCITWFVRYLLFLTITNE